MFQVESAQYLNAERNNMIRFLTILTNYNKKNKTAFTTLRPVPVTAMNCYYVRLAPAQVDVKCVAGAEKLLPELWPMTLLHSLQCFMVGKLCSGKRNVFPGWQIEFSSLFLRYFSNGTLSFFVVQMENRFPGKFVTNKTLLTMLCMATLFCRGVCMVRLIKSQYLLFSNYTKLIFNFYLWTPVIKHI